MCTLRTHIPVKLRMAFFAALSGYETALADNTEIERHMA